MRTSIAGISVLVAMATFLTMVPRVSAAPAISVQGYDSGGGFVFADGSSPMPVGATVEIRVWVDLDSCDPISVNWGDGSQTETQNYGGSLAKLWEHKYTKEGTYTITARESMCPGSLSITKQIVIGGIGFLFDPASPLFMPVVFSLILAVVGLALANVKIALPRGRPGAPPQSTPAPVPRPRLRYSGITADMILHSVRLREVPPGAPMQYDPLNGPKIGMVFGQPTNINQRVGCHACGSPLGYTVEGWFCLNPSCPLIGQGPRGFPRNM